MSGNLVAAIQHKTLPIYGVQFHPEVDLTVNGRDILKNFVYTVSQFNSGTSNKGHLEPFNKDNPLYTK